MNRFLPKLLFALALLAFCITIPDYAAAQSPGACPGPGSGVFTGCYYNNITLSGDPVFVRTDPNINFYWGNSSPDDALPALNFSARWQGNFTFSSGSYIFGVTASDGMRLFIDNNLIIDNWRDQPPFSYTATQPVSQGNHLITVEYYEKLGGATAQVSWQNISPATVAAPVPVISSFTAAPASATPGQPVTLSWSVSGATSISIDNGVGDVTGLSSFTAFPVQTTNYTLRAYSSTDTSTAMATVTVGPAVDRQPPTTPTLVSAIADSTNQVDLVWIASTDDTGVAGYQILRNGMVIASVPGATLTWADTSASANSTWIYTVKAYDATPNYSAASNSIQVVTPAAAQAPGSCPAPGNGVFTGCYYNNITLSGNPVFVRTDPAIRFYWGDSSPDNSLPPLNFSVRWQGNFTLSSGIYTFYVITSDGMRLYVDGNLIINNWQDQSPSIYTATQALSAGNHLISVEYYERLGEAKAQVSWQNTSPATRTTPVISSFTAAPASTTPGQPVTLSWSVSGATSISIDNGVGDVTGLSSFTAYPAQTTNYTLRAYSSTDTSTAIAAVTVGSAADTQPPTAPTLVSANAGSANQIDLVWTPATDDTGVAGYQIIRNGTVAGSVPGATLTWTDTSAGANSTWIYTIRAYDATPNYSAASNSLSVTTPGAATTNTATASVTWHGACWQNATIYGITGNFQAIDFTLTTSTPVPLQGTLFFAPNCDPGQGTDNMNDFNSLTGSTHMVQGFSHFPDVIPTSAYYWVGSRTADGKCAPGSPCSGCVNYTKATPDCNTLP